MKVLVAGATGAIGRQLLPLLRAQGMDVVALTRRSGDANRWLRSDGYKAEPFDVFDADSVRQVFERVRPDAVINQLTAIPANFNPRRIRTQMAATNRLREEGTRNLVRAAADVGSRRFVSQSIAFAYAPAANTPADEEQELFDAAPSGFDAAVRAIRACESATLGEADIEGVVLRYGYFCGPGTAYAPGGATFSAVKAGRLPIIGNGDGVFSFIHVLDAAHATVQALLSSATGTFNIVDDTPVALSDWLPWLASRLDAAEPKTIPRWLGRLLAGRFADYFMNLQVGASNARARNELDWKPTLATWQDGLGESLRDR